MLVFVNPNALTLSNGTASKVVHLHGDGKIFKVIEKLKERPELFEGDALIRKRKK